MLDKRYQRYTTGCSYTFTISCNKYNCTYRFNGNGGTIAGQSTVTKDALYGGSIHIPVAARGKPDTSGTGN